MGRVRKFWRLPTSDRSLLLKATALLWSVTVGLWLLPLGALRRLLRRATGAKVAPGGHGPTKDRIIWAMATAQRLVPRATCLSRALAAEVLLARSGDHADILIGVAKTGEGRLEADAWLARDELVPAG